jgi:purine catabolism regulator
MPVTVGELVAMPHLGLSVLGGASGLYHQATWAHVCELEDPVPWLEGGEVLMTTGMAIPAAKDRQLGYLRRLIGRRVAALAISADMHAPPLHPEMLAEADAGELPVLSVSIEVPFLAISRVVAAANADQTGHSLLTHVRIFDTLRTTTAQGLGVAQLFARLEELSGYRLYVASPAGRPMIEGVPAPPAGTVSLPREPGQPPFIPGGLVVSIPVGDRVAGYLIALERGDARPAGVPAVQHIATIAALELTNSRRQREVRRREGAETLAELLAGALDEAAAAKRLALAGFGDDPDLVLLAVWTSGAVSDAALDQAWSDLSVPHLLLQQRQLFALLPAAGDAVDVVADSPGIRAGCSRPFRVRAGFAGARRESLWCLQRAIDRSLPLVRFSDGDDDLAWLPADAGALREAAERVLGPLRCYDARRGTALVASLRSWLEHGRSTSAAARALSIHKHTLAYRLGRVEQLTGRNLSAVPDLVDIWLALRADEIIREDGSPPES